MEERLRACPLGDVSGFDAILAAPGHSQLSGVLAAVVFTGMILLLSERTSDTAIQPSRRNALVVMMPTFFGLLIVSFSFAVTMGEINCKRAEAATISVAGLFAVSAVGTMYALAWLFNAYEKGFRALSTISGSIVFMLSAMVFTQMGLTVVDFQDKYEQDHVSNIVIWIYTAAAVVGVIGLWIRWMTRRPTARERQSTNSAIAIIAYSIFALILFNTVIAFPVSNWDDKVAPWYALIAAIASLIGIAPPVYLMLITTPHRDGIKTQEPGRATGGPIVSAPEDTKIVSRSIPRTEDEEFDRQVSAGSHLPGSQAPL
jgi:hypothetical protein